MKIKLLLAGFMIASVSMPSVMAQEPVELRKVAETDMFASGNGSQESPYVVSNRRHLVNMRNVLTAGQTVHFELGADIDMADLYWVPLNYADPYNFRIIFDGKGHTLSNFRCDYIQYPSFFGVLYGECRNVKFENAYIYQNLSGSSPAVVAGYCGTGGKPGVMEQVAVVNSTVLCGPKHNAPMGGIAGQFGEGSIRNCYAADVTVKRTVGVYNNGCGGIIGRVRNKVTVENCWASGIVDAVRLDNAGGIWGRAVESGGWTLRNNIGWMTKITAAWSSNRVGGRTKNADNSNGNTLGENYGFTGTELLLYVDNQTTPSKPHDVGNQGSVADRSIAGTDATNIIDAARALGWDETIWDLSGSVPKFRWEK